MTNMNKEEARAIQALREIRDALAENGSCAGPLDRFQQALDKVDSHTRTNLDNAYGALLKASADEAFQTFAEVTNEFKKLSDGFKLGQKMAENGKDDLFFPSVATHLGQISAVLTEIKKATGKLNKSLDGLEESYEKSDVLALIKEGETIKEILEKLLGGFGELKKNIENKAV